MNNPAYYLLVLAFVAQAATAQEIDEKRILKSLQGDEIKWDEGNEDGVFMMRNKKTKKWGMYQFLYDGNKVKELIPMHYDSLRYFPFNGNFTAVYNDGKVGFYLSAWTYDEKAKQTVPCNYEGYQRFTVDNATYLGVVKGGKWGWVDWLTGEERSAFEYETKEELPYPDWEQEAFPD